MQTGHHCNFSFFIFKIIHLHPHLQMYRLLGVRLCSFLSVKIPLFILSSLLTPESPLLLSPSRYSTNTSFATFLNNKSTLNPDKALVSTYGI